MKKSKGMTLIEVLIGMGLSALIMAATFVIVQYSANTYDATADMVKRNNNTYDAINIINRYVREASFCTVSDNGNSLYLITEVGDGTETLMRFAYDTDDAMLVIDKMNGSDQLIVSKGISRMTWEIIQNGVKYTAYEISPVGTEEILFQGYAAKRGH